MKRKEICSKNFWKVEDIFASTKEWQKYYDELAKNIDFSAFIGKLGNKSDFLECLKKEDEVGKKIERLYVYANMRHDEDQTNAEFDELLSKAQQLYVKISTNTSFMLPELTALDDSVLNSYIADPDFADYDYQLKGVIQAKPHVLSKETEEVLALGGEMYSSFRDIFSKIDNADLPFPTVKVDGKNVKVTHGTYSVLMQSKDREVRKKTFKAYYKAYNKLLNAITATYYGNVKKNVFIARAKKYESCLDMALKGEDVELAVYENLLDAVHKATPVMHKYIEAKKQALGYGDMHMYDIYTPVVEDVDLKLEFEDAYKLVQEGLAPLGKDYVALLEKAKSDGWIDVYENEGKRSGAYCTSIYEVHPYVLLNYQKTTHDVFTIAHEMGHAMHSYFSNGALPFAKADYKIFVAEVASTVNEVLLLKHILGTAKDVKLKKYLLSYLIEMIRTTLFRQTMFAEFEYDAHKKVEKGQPLTKEGMNKTYLKLNKQYYGKSIVSDKEISYEWARIPHFYSAFYVYKYATGIISALAISNRILTEGETAVKDYFAFLSSGGSSDPVSLLKIAGVDLTKKTAFENAMKVFEDTLNEFISL